MGLKSMREAANLTQKEAAAKLGVHQSAVAQWETGRTSPRTARLAQIAALYGCGVADLIEPEAYGAGAPSGAGTVHTGAAAAQGR